MKRVAGDVFVVGYAAAAGLATLAVVLPFYIAQEVWHHLRREPNRVPATLARSPRGQD